MIDLIKRDILPVSKQTPDEFLGRLTSILNRGSIHSATDNFDGMTLYYHVVGVVTCIAPPTSGHVQVQVVEEGQWVESIRGGRPFPSERTLLVSVSRLCSASLSSTAKKPP